MEREIQLKVKEALPMDVGKGIVRLDPYIMEKLEVNSGDVIEIEGTKKAAGLVWRAKPGGDWSVVRLDGILRSNAGVRIDDTVTIRKAEAKPAKEIRVAPTQEIDYELDPDAFREQIMNMPLLVGNIVLDERITGERNLEFYVVDTVPRGIVQVVPTTQILIEKKPMQVKLSVGVRYEDIGGLKHEIEEIREMVEIPMRHPEVFKRLGITPPKGVLLYGPPGCGKTLLAKAVASETDAHFIALNGPEIMSKYYGQSEENLRNIFQEAKEKAPSIIFIDEIDAIAPKRDESKGDVERRVVAQLLTMMDGLEARGDVVVIAATNRPHDIDPALRRPGRFDREIEIRVPDINGRKEIFYIHIRRMPLEIEKGKDYETTKEELVQWLVSVTHGFTGADIAALCREAAMHALKRVVPELKKHEGKSIPREFLEKIVVRREDFLHALKKVEPSGMREVMINVPTVRWEDIGGLDDVRQQLIEMIEWPLRFAKTYKQLGITAPKGVLLVGPPGCGKTLLAKAVAHESNANFISIKGPEIFSKWVGESEKAIREIFKRARQMAPAIIFFDEIDSIAPKRGTCTGTHVTESVVNQILTELDGLEELHNVVVIGASNRPELIDDALLRPGRIDHTVYVPLPDAKARKEILSVYLKNMPIAEDVSLDELVKRTEGFSGADIAALCREAGLSAIREIVEKYGTSKKVEEEIQKLKEIKRSHFERAFKKVKPSLSKEEIARWASYEEERKKKE